VQLLALNASVARSQAPARPWPAQEKHLLPELRQPKPAAFITHRAGFAIWVFSGGMLRPQRDLNPWPASLAVTKRHYSSPTEPGEVTGSDVKCPNVTELGRLPDDSGGAARGPMADLRGVVETALASALKLAAEAQRWELVAQLAEELAARRCSRASGPLGRRSHVRRTSRSEA
jgi:hypothetical protein